MKNYIYFNDKQFRFFEAKDKEGARDYVINYCDLSFNPQFLEIFKDITNRCFSVPTSLAALNLKKFFSLVGGGEGVMCFMDRQSPTKTRVLEFGGFYETIHADMINSAYARSRGFRDFDDFKNQDFQGHQEYTDNYTMGIYTTDYCKKYLVALNKFFKTNFEFYEFVTTENLIEAIVVNQDCSNIDCELFNDSQEYIDFATDFINQFSK